MANLLLFLAILFAWIVCVGIVGLLIGGVAWLLARQAVRPMIPAFAVQAGHILASFPALLLLFFLGEIDAMTTMVSLLLLCGVAVVLVWLIMRPGLMPVIVLAVFHIVDFGLACLFGAGDLEMAVWGGLAASFLLRTAGIVLMIIGLWITTKTRRPMAMSATESA